MEVVGFICLFLFRILCWDLQIEEKAAHCCLALLVYSGVCSDSEESLSIPIMPYIYRAASHLYGLSPVSLWTLQLFFQRSIIVGSLALTLSKTGNHWRLSSRKVTDFNRLILVIGWPTGCK